MIRLARRRAMVAAKPRQVAYRKAAAATADGGSRGPTSKSTCNPCASAVPWSLDGERGITRGYLFQELRWHPSKNS